MKTKQEILEVISEVKHPAINHSLLDLGIVKDIEIEDNEVGLKFVFPFPNIPIEDTLINSIEMPLNDIGCTLFYDIVLMTEEEKAKFMQMEAEGWKGL
jgi:metal-sulfur cluster biosynthetic enzyme